MKNKLILTLIFMLGIIYYANAQSTSTTINLVNNTSCSVSVILTSDNGAACGSYSAFTPPISVPAHSSLSYTLSTAPWNYIIGPISDFCLINVYLTSGGVKLADPSATCIFPSSDYSWTYCTPTGSIVWTDAPTSPPAPIPTTATVTFN